MDRSHLDTEPHRRPVRVMHVFHKLDIGGAELRMLDIARRLDPADFELHICILSEQPGELCHEIAALGTKFHFIRLGPRFPYYFKKLLRSEKIDVVHPHMHYSAGLILRLAEQVGTPGRIAHFQSCSDGQGNGLRRRLQRRVMRSWIDKYATHILTCGKTVMSRAWDSHWESDSRCHVIFDGIDPKPFQIRSTRAEVAREFGSEENQPLYIHVGNIRRPKNHHKLVSIFAQVLVHKPNAKLLLVGRDLDGSLAGLRSKVAELGISDSVYFVGSRSDVPRLMRAADVMIFPSIWEGLPGVVMEACAAGLPVLASDLPEIREIADLLPLVQCMSLNADDSAWAAAAKKLAPLNNEDKLLHQAFQTFDSSPFHIDECMKQFCQLWQAASLNTLDWSQEKAA